MEEKNIVSITQAKERRKDKRFKHSSYCELVSDKMTKPLLAKTLDISKGGARVKYTTSEPFVPNSIVNIYINNLRINKTAAIVWLDSLNKINHTAGIKFNEPIKLPKELIKVSESDFKTKSVWQWLRF